MTKADTRASRFDPAHIPQWCADLEHEYYCELHVRYLPAGVSKQARAGWWEVEVSFPPRGVLEPWSYTERVPFQGKTCKEPEVILFNLVATVSAKLTNHPQAKFWRREPQA